MRCPSCSHEMAQRTLDGHYGARVRLDLCQGCAALWCDTSESASLTTRAVLEVIAAMQERGTS